MEPPVQRQRVQKMAQEVTGHCGGVGVGDSE